MINQTTITVILIIFLNIELLQCDNCSLCKPRSFNNKSEALCKCNDDYFCNLQKNNTCMKCGGGGGGDCYDFWKIKVNSTKFDISTLIKTIINNYYNIDDVDKLETIFNIVVNKFNQNNDIVNNITASINIVDDYILKIIKELEDTNNKMVEIEDTVKGLHYGDDVSHSELFVKLIQDLYKQIREIFNKIQVVNVDSNRNNRVDNFKTNLKNIRAFIRQFQQFPNVDNKTFQFNKNFDNELEFLENVLLKYSQIDKTPTFDDYTKIMQTLDEDVAKLKKLVIDLINHLLNIYQYVDDVAKLIDKSGKITKSTNDFQLQLGQSVKDETEFLQQLELLKKERLYLEKIRQQQINLERIGKFTTILNRKIIEFRFVLNKTKNEIKMNETTISDKYQQYSNKQLIINKKLNKFNFMTMDLNKLLTDLLLEKEIIQQFDKYETIDNLMIEIDELRVKLENYIDEISKYCRTTRQTNGK